LKLLIKLAIAALLANAAYRIGSEYLTYIKFRDAIRDAAMFKATDDVELRKKIMDLSEVLEAIKANKIVDAQENPFANTVTYGVHKFHRFHTATNHFYISRPIFLHRPTFNAWPRALQDTMLEAVKASIPMQRDLHEKEEADAQVTIRKEGGEIVELTPAEHSAFVSAVAPIFDEAGKQFFPRTDPAVR